MGWYGGLGGRRETQPAVLPGIAQTMPTPDPTTGMIECNWTSQYTLTVVRKTQRHSCSAGQEAVLVMKSVQDGVCHNSA